MIVIADTTPLISLMKIGRLDLIFHLFGEIMIPKAVFDELVYNSRFPEESRQMKESSFIKTVVVEDIKSVELLRRSTGLDAGESEAIILSDKLKASILLMDEVKGRQVAKQMGIQIMGTIGMLLAAYRSEVLSKQEILQYINILKVSGRHVSDKLYEQLIEKLDS